MPPESTLSWLSLAYALERLGDPSRYQRYAVLYGVLEVWHIDG